MEHEFYDFPYIYTVYIGNVITPTDFHSIIFQRGGEKPPTRSTFRPIYSPFPLPRPGFRRVRASAVLQVAQLSAPAGPHPPVVVGMLGARSVTGEPSDEAFFIKIQKGVL